LLASTGKVGEFHVVWQVSPCKSPAFVCEAFTQQCRQFQW